MEKRPSKSAKVSTKNTLFWLLSLTTLFNCALLLYRLNFISYDYSQLASIGDIARYRGFPTFIFLIWNLFLAWIPYWIALSLKYIKKSKALMGITLISWLLFFPNAPYIITDLLHLKSRPPIPMWFDVLLFFSFAWTGLILGFASLMEVERFLKKRLSAVPIFLLISSALCLCSFGVFVGRFQRWNSWDVFTNPFHLLFDMAEVLMNPTAYWGTFGLAIVLSGMLILGYWTLKNLGRIVE